MKNIHELIRAINALKVDPSESYIPARPISAEVTIKSQLPSYHPVAILVIKIGYDAQPRLYAEADPVTQPDWQEYMTTQALTNIKLYKSSLYIALGEPEIHG